MAWWFWMLVGLAFLGAEVLTPSGFYLLFFGLAALVVGTFRAVGWAELPWTQWLLFSGLSILSLIAFRGPLHARVVSRQEPPEPIDSLVGEVAVVLEDLPVGGVGKAELRGSTWTVRNGGMTPLGKGRRCRVERVDGLTLGVRGEE